MKQLKLTYELKLEFESVVRTKVNTKVKRQYIFFVPPGRRVQQGLDVSKIL